MAASKTYLDSIKTESANWPIREAKILTHIFVGENYQRKPLRKWNRNVVSVNYISYSCPYRSMENLRPSTTHLFTVLKYLFNKIYYIRKAIDTHNDFQITFSANSKSHYSNDSQHWNEIASCFAAIGQYNYIFGSKF